MLLAPGMGRSTSQEVILTPSVYQLSGSLGIGETSTTRRGLPDGVMKSVLEPPVTTMRILASGISFFARVAWTTAAISSWDQGRGNWILRAEFSKRSIWASRK